MQQGWRRLGRALSALCPALCEVCGRWPDGPLCADCRRDLAPLLPRCPGCALLLAPGLPRCDACRREPPPWERVVARVDFGHPWDAWIRAFKFRQQPGLAGALADLWLDNPAVPDMLAQADAWLPIPLAPARLAHRGYNQTWELMRALARRVPPPRSEPALLARSADAPILHHLDRADRLEQSASLFHVPAALHSRVRGRHLLLVDDVMTTGATLQAATQALLAAGAAGVSALVFARTPPPVE